MPEQSQQIVITALSVDGEGIGRLDDGRVTFVDGALPGERVVVMPQTVHRRITHSTVIERVSQSPGRVPAGCDLLACGGCPLRSASLQLQAEHKQLRLVDTFRRLAGIDLTPILAPMTSFDDGWGYRHRVRLHAQWQPQDSSSHQTQEQGQWQLGYHSRKGHKLVPLSTCPVIWPELERLGRSVASAIATLPRAAKLVEVDLAYSRRDGRGAGRLITSGPMHLLRSQLEWIEHSGLGGLQVVAADGTLRWGNLSLRYDHSQAEVFDLRFEPGQFTQANCTGNEALVAQVLSQVAPRAGLNVVEMHAGIGNFSLPLARAGAEVIAVEQNKQAAQMLARNAALAGARVTIHATSDRQALALLTKQADVLLLDPTRQGAREVAQWLGEGGSLVPVRVVYVSCDPATLARDARLMQQSGYRPVHAAGLDLFAQTPHVESVVTFDRT